MTGTHTALLRPSHASRHSLFRGTALRITPLLVALAFVSGCAYQPPTSVDRNSPKFKADLTDCRASAEKAAHHAVISRFPLFISYPVSLPLKERAETRKCMTGKGYPVADRGGPEGGRDSPPA